MIRALTLSCLLLVPATAGASGSRPMVALTATPARLTLAGSGSAEIRVANPGRAAVVVDVTRAGFALDLRGRPRILARFGAGAWLALRPRRLALPAGGSARLVVAAHLPPRAEPGDHHALVLLTTRPQRAAAVAVRMRVGVVVLVRAPGRIVHRLGVGGLTVRRAGRARVLELLVVNRGNVTETLRRGRVGISLLRRGRVVARLAPSPRELSPRSRAIVPLACPGGLRGRLAARVELSSGLLRTFSIRL